MCWPFWKPPGGGQEECDGLKKPMFMFVFKGAPNLGVKNWGEKPLNSWGCVELMLNALGALCVGEPSKPMTLWAPFKPMLECKGAHIG